MCICPLNTLRMRGISVTFFHFIDFILHSSDFLPSAKSLNPQGKVDLFPDKGVAAFPYNKTKVCSSSVIFFNEDTVFSA